MKIEATEFVPFLTDNIDVLSATKKPLWHPLGFTSCLIHSVENLFEVRVHFWPELDRRTNNPDWPIHTHRYDLSSLVIEGSVQDIQYDSVAGDEHYLYTVSYDGANSGINRTGSRVSLRESESTQRDAGNMYFVERGVFHRSVVEVKKSAITLAVMSRFGDAPPTVAGQAKSERYPYIRENYDSNKFWTKVRGALDLLKT